MTNYHLLNTILESSNFLKIDRDKLEIKTDEIGLSTYDNDQILEFKRDLIEGGNKNRILYLDNNVSIDEFNSFAYGSEFPLIAFEKLEDGFVPVIIFRERKALKFKRIFKSGTETKSFNEDLKENLFRDGQGQIMLLAVFSFKSFSTEGETEINNNGEATPFRKLLNLLSEERKDIFYILIYAVVIGLVGLVLPLGLKATVEFLSGGVVFTSIYLLIGLVILAVLAAGGLQIMQVTILEFVQRRVFTKAALEFTYRIPRIRVESILNTYAPELINRFFDVMTVQKGLPKILIDLLTAAIQIFFGLLLLSFYHPFFVFFGLILMATLLLIFYLTGPKGLKTSIVESKYKYKVVYWLEELARSINAFKMAGNTSLPIQKTESNVNNYLKNRSSHFRILITQYSFVIVFKAIVTGGLLIIGTILLVDRQITLGQFVASEVIIILIIGSVEKIIMYMDVVYDILTAADKISQVTTIPLEKMGGFKIPKKGQGEGFSIEIKNLNYKYSNGNDYALKNINLSIQCSEKLCISGSTSSGKSTLVNAISGINQDYEGLISINGYTMKDLDITSIRDQVAQNSSEYDIFDGTILENILVGNPLARPEVAMDAIQKIGLAERVNSLPDGLNTHINPGGQGFSRSFVNKLILARCLAKEPKLMILKDFFRFLPRHDKLQILNVLHGSSCNFTLINVSNDPLIMSACDRVIYLQDGQIVADGTYEEIKEQGLIN